MNNKTHPTMQRIFDFTGENPSDIARAIDTTPQNINNWIKRGISKTGAIALSEKYNLPIDWILTGVGEPMPLPQEVQDLLNQCSTPKIITEEDKKRLIPIKLYDVRACCGSGNNIFEFEPLKKELNFEPDFFEKRNLDEKYCVMIYASNDSMEGYICDGDAVMLDKSATDVKDGEVYVVWFEGELMIKRIFKDTGGVLILTSDNKKYRDREVNQDNGDTFRIIGEVVYRSG